MKKPPIKGYVLFTLGRWTASCLCLFVPIIKERNLIHMVCETGLQHERFLKIPLGLQEMQKSILVLSILDTDQLNIFDSRYSSKQCRPPPPRSARQPAAVDWFVLLGFFNVRFTGGPGAAISDLAVRLFCLLGYGAAVVGKSGEIIAELPVVLELG